MLTKEQLQQNDQPESKLLCLPKEIVLGILKCRILDVFDRSCLVLTCKAVANLMTNFKLSLVLKKGLKSGKEAERLESLEDNLDYMYSDEDELLEELHELEQRFRGRVDQTRFNNFLLRLDRGWNRSESRLCCSCKTFQSTSKAYWEEKAQIYRFKSDKPAARGYRIMEDCRCACEPEERIKEWIDARGKTGKETIPCPDCIFRATREHAPFCGCCGEGCCDSEDGCGCGGCQCIN